MKRLGRWLLLFLIAMSTWFVVLRAYEVNCVALCARYDTESNESQMASEFKKPLLAVKKSTATKVRTYYDVPLSRELQDYIIFLCEKHHIDPAIVIAMIHRESNFKANAIGDGGDSEGLMQIQRKWHQARMDRLDCTNLLDPLQNVKVGIDLLAELIDRYDGDVAKALTAYNQGYCAGTVTNYAHAVLAYSETIRH